MMFFASAKLRASGLAQAVFSGMLRKRASPVFPARKEGRIPRAAQTVVAARPVVELFSR